METLLTVLVIFVILFFLFEGFARLCIDGLFSLLNKTVDNTVAPALREMDKILIPKKKGGKP